MSDDDSVEIKFGLPKKKYNFKERYHNDPEFKKKHLEYINKPVTCECGYETTKSNILNHMKTKKHQRMVSKTVSKEEYKELEKKYKNMKKILESIISNLKNI
jgi:hypothetical protein